jgi:hypothetical protein
MKIVRRESVCAILGPAGIHHCATCFCLATTCRIHVPEAHCLMLNPSNEINHCRNVSIHALQVVLKRGPVPQFAVEDEAFFSFLR